MNMTLDIVCNVDNNYAQHCAAMLCSLFDNNSNHDIHAHVLTHGLSDGNMKVIQLLANRYNKKVTFHNIDEAILDGVQFRKNRPLTKAAYYRILLSSVIDATIDKILYLDCDIIVLGDISELFNIELDNYALAATSDISPYNSSHRMFLQLQMDDNAFCSGFMMVNLKYWRDNNVQEKLINFSTKKRKVVFLHDQDSLNYVFKNKWFRLPFKWNATPLSICPIDNAMKSFDYVESYFTPKIMHYSGYFKPWNNAWFPEKKYYIKYLKMSGFPNPQIYNAGKIYRYNVFISVLRYYINKYVRPLLPNIVEMVFQDIFNLIELLYVILFKRNQFNMFLLKKWLSKYGVEI